METLTPSEQLVYGYVTYEKQKFGDIKKQTTLSERTVRYRLRKLVNMNLIRQIPDFKDLRSSWYVRQ